MRDVLQQVIDASTLGSIYALMALGLVLVFSIMGLMNFAYGELVMIASYTLLVLGRGHWMLGIVGVIVVSVAVSILMERVAFRPVRDAPPVTMMITSFALAFVLQNLVVAVIGPSAEAITVPSFLGEGITVAGLRISKLDLLTIATTSILLLGLALLMRRTNFGMRLRAAASDFRMARLLGIDANRTIVGAFALSGALAGVVGLLLVAYKGSVSPDMGLKPLLVAFVGAVIGGVGSIAGAVVGGFLLGFVTVGLQTWLPDPFVPFRDAFVFLFVILVLLLRPQGLMGLKSMVERV